MKYTLLLCALIASSAVADLPSDAARFKLKRVTDGDTVVTSDDTRIRLWGIDMPERDQPYGGKATTALKRMLRWEKLYLETKNVGNHCIILLAILSSRLSSSLRSTSSFHNIDALTLRAPAK